MDSYDSYAGVNKQGENSMQKKAGRGAICSQLIQKPTPEVHFSDLVKCIS